MKRVMPPSSSLRLLFSLLAIVAFTATARSEIIYDNSDTGGTNVYYNTAFEFGDEVLLGGTSRVMSQFLSTNPTARWVRMETRRPEPSSMTAASFPSRQDGKPKSLAASISPFQPT
jgi:hypothetical protein